MARTRSSKGPDESSSSPAGTKRAAPKESSSSPAPKRPRGRPSKKEKKQTTIEDTMQGIEDDKDVEKQINEDEEKTAVEDSMTGIEDDKDVEKQINGQEQTRKDENVKNGHHGDEEKKEGLKEDEKNAFDEVKSDETEVKKSAQEEQDTKTADISKDNKSIVEDDKRDAKIPSSILEKGIIYFFYRGRVGVEHPQGIEDVARSYIILRPIPLGASLGEGPLEDLGTSRLLALPKKMMPKSKRDRFLAFVEKPKTSIKELRQQFEHNDYSTKTSGTSHVPSATPFAEGVYAITSTGRESHLAYEITAPKIGELQKDLGVNEKGSYVLSVKNPKAPGPANASIANPAQYPEKIQSKFRDLRWSPLEPEMLDYEHTQVLIIGEGMGVLGKAVEEMSKDQKDDSKDKPEEELDHLEEEDHDRVENLKEHDPVFADLGLSAKEYSKMKSTW